jgi:chromosome partitioning protein
MFDRALDYLAGLIDTPPAIDILNTNAIVASDAIVGVSMPDTSSTFGITGLIQFLNEIREIPNIHPTLIGIIANGYDSRNRLDQKILEQLQSLKNEEGYSLTFDTPIRHTVAIPECTAAGKNIFEYRPDSAGALDFIKVTDEILKRVQ